MKATGIKCIFKYIYFYIYEVESFLSWQIFPHCSLKTHLVLPILLTDSENGYIPNMLSVPGIPFVCGCYTLGDVYKVKEKTLGAASQRFREHCRWSGQKDAVVSLHRLRPWGLRARQHLKEKLKMSVDYKWEQNCLRTGMATVYFWPPEEQDFLIAGEGNQSKVPVWVRACWVFSTVANSHEVLESMVRTGTNANRLLRSESTGAGRLQEQKRKKKFFYLVLRADCIIQDHLFSQQSVTLHGGFYNH